MALVPHKLTALNKKKARTHSKSPNGDNTAPIRNIREKHKETPIEVNTSYFNALLGIKIPQPKISLLHNCNEGLYIGFACLVDTVCGLCLDYNKMFVENL